LFAGTVALRVGLTCIGITQPWIVLGLSVLTGVLIHGGLMLWSKPPVLRDMVQLLSVGPVTWCGERRRESR
jgi:hypothetical protein